MIQIVVLELVAGGYSFGVVGEYKMCCVFMTIGADMADSSDNVDRILIVLIFKSVQKS